MKYKKIILSSSLFYDHLVYLNLYLNIEGFINANIFCKVIIEFFT